MTALRTRGQASAAAAVANLAAAGRSHAVLLVGPAASGKTTLAADLAATLLCQATSPGDRPCGSCRGCRMVDSGNHPDLHRRGPDGPAGQVGIAAIRTLATDIALLPVEGGARVAILEGASRMSEDAQHALLKTLEEPPVGVTIILCADDEDRLLPTIRSRCARVRLGPVGTRDIEALLDERGLADAPTAARLARLAAGRPGAAVAYARAPEAATARREAGRTLIDLLDVSASVRLRQARDLAALADAATAALTGPTPSATRSRAAGSGEADDADETQRPTRASASDRRRAVTWLIDAWIDLARDLAVAPLAGPRALHDPDLQEEIERAARRLAPGVASDFVGRATRAALALDVNASPELVLDVLILAWPHAEAAAA